MELVVPQEAKFEPVQNNVLDVIQQVIEKQIIVVGSFSGSSSAAAVAAGASPIIQVNIPYGNQTSRIDLSSIYLTGDLLITTAISGTDYTTTDLFTLPYTPASSELFSSLQISTSSGQVIELIQNCDVVNQVLKLSVSQDWLDTVGSMGCNELNRNKRRQPTYTGTMATTTTMTGTLNMKLDALLCSGFIGKLHKLFPTHLVGGLVLTLTMKPDANIAFDLNVADVTSYVLSNVRCNYEEAIMKSEYISSFISSYPLGIELLFDTYSVFNVSPVSLSTTSTEIQFNLNAQKVKALIAVVRSKAATASDVKNDMAFSSDIFSGGAGSYQWNLGGVLMPAYPVQNYPRAMEEWAKVCRLNDFPHCQLLTYKQFSTNDPINAVASRKVWSDTAGNTFNSLDKQLGCFVASLDLEKYDSTNRSGVSISGQSSLTLAWGGTAITDAIVTIIACHEKVLKVQDGRIQTYQ